MAQRRLPQRFFARDTRDVARDLLGCTLARRLSGGVLRARLVEVEAYHGLDDHASHARFGRTARASIMFGPPGRAYVFLIYGMHHCLNVVCMPRDFPAAVLIRGVDRLRWSGREPCPLAEPKDGRAIGPGRLTRALGVTVAQHNVAKVYGAGAELWIEGPAPGGAMVRSSPRVGVDYAGASAAWPWRYELLDDEA